MSDLNTIEFIDIPSIIENIDIYKEIFVRDGILAFRNANLSHEEHVVVHDIFGNALGSHRETHTDGYLENHSNTYEYGGWGSTPGPDDIILSWHIEHPSFENRIVLGTWNMHNFKTDSDNGKTYFVDNKAMHERMPNHFKEFAKKCTIIDPYPYSEASGKHQLLLDHWLTGKPVITVSHIYKMAEADNLENNQLPKLYKFDGNDPSESDYRQYFEIIKWIHDQLYGNLDARIVHRWKQGDLVIPDMSRMCHAVTGGFSSEDREFRGIWGRRDKHETGTI